MERLDRRLADKGDSIDANKEELLRLSNALTTINRRNAGEITKKKFMNLTSLESGRDASSSPDRATSDKIKETDGEGEDKKDEFEIIEALEKDVNTLKT